MSEMALDLIRRAKAEGWKRLDLGNTGIVGEVPAEIWELTELEELILSGIWLEKIDGKSVTKLSRYDGPGNSILAFPPPPKPIGKNDQHERKPSNRYATGLGGLRRLILTSAPITSLSHFEHLPSIQYLDLSWSKVSDLSALEQLLHLEHLALEWTPIYDIKPIGNLSALKSLNIANTKIVDLEPLRSLVMIETLNIAFTKVADIQPLRSMKGLRSLSMKNTMVSDLEPIVVLKELQLLDISYSKIENISPISRLPLLQSLFLSYTEIVSIDEIAFLESLEFLEINHTRVTTFPSNSSLFALRHLEIGWTTLADIDGLSHLSKLENLVLSDTAITNIAPLINLGQLRFLDISGTMVDDLLPLSNLDQLQFLNLQRTLVSSIRPLEKFLKSNLLVYAGSYMPIVHIRAIYIDDNDRIKDPPKEIAIKGNQAILDYWRDEARKGKTPLKELKLFLLGNSTAGKSTLAHVLIHKEYPQQTYSTLGADLSQTWELEDKQICIWDFGGQEFFHATYRLWMNDSAVYVVIVDPERDRYGSSPTEIHYAGKAASEMEDLEHFPHIYWLENVRTYAPYSNVLVLWNKITFDDCSSLTLDASAKAMFTGDAKVMAFPSDLWGIFHDQDPEWEAMWRVFHNQLKREIDSRLSKNGTIIAYYPDIRSVIDNLALGRIWMSLHELEGICKEFDDTPTIGNILTYLSDMCGAIFYRKPQPNDPSALPERVFVNPNRLNQLFYAILNWDTKQAGGHFTRDFAIRQVGQELESMGVTDVAEADLPGFVNELLGLMKQFEIIFEVKEGIGAFVAPHYLSNIQPVGMNSVVKFNELEPNLFLRFPNYIPRHIIPRFIAAKGLLAIQDFYWKYGIVFTQENIAASVSVDYYQTRAISVMLGNSNAREGELNPLSTIFEDLQNLIEKNTQFEISVDNTNWVTFQSLRDAIPQRSEKVKTVDGVFIDLEPFRKILPALGVKPHHPSEVRTELGFQDLMNNVSSLREEMRINFAKNHEDNRQILAAQGRDEVKLQKLVHLIRTIQEQNSDSRDQHNAWLVSLLNKVDTIVERQDLLEEWLEQINQVMITGFVEQSAALQEYLESLLPPTNGQPFDRTKVNILKLVLTTIAMEFLQKEDRETLLPIVDSFLVETTATELKQTLKRFLSQVPREFKS